MVINCIVLSLTLLIIIFYVVDNIWVKSLMDCGLIVSVMNPRDKSLMDCGLIVLVTLGTKV